MKTRRSVEGFALCTALVLAIGAAPGALDSATVDQRAARWQPTARERQWEQIGWVNGIVPALEQARKSQRPVFLFTHDGRLNVGRC